MELSAAVAGQMMRRGSLRIALRLVRKSRELRASTGSLDPCFWRREDESGRAWYPSGPRLIPVHVAASARVVMQEGTAQTPPRSVRSAARKIGLNEIDLGGGRGIRVDANVDGDALGRVLDVLGRR